MNHKANFRLHNLDNANQVNITPEGEETRLRSYTLDQLCQGLNGFGQELEEKNEMNEDDVNNHSKDYLDNLLERFDESSILIDDRKYLNYFLVSDTDSFAKNDAICFKGFFLDTQGEDTSFLLKLKPNLACDGFDDDKLILITRFQLKKSKDIDGRFECSDERLSLDDRPLMEIDINKSQLNINMLDIRQVRPDVIELLWTLVRRPVGIQEQQQEATIAFK